jgi:enamine deaminase RidA (YjgF/YER057c/UK114 family)
MPINRLEGEESGVDNVLAFSSGVSVQRPEFMLTERMLPGEPLTAVFQRLADQLAASEAALLSLMVYGSIAARDEIEAAMRRTLGETGWPITWIDGGSCEGYPLAGVQAFAVSGRPVTRVRLGRLIVGSVYEDGGARYCLLGGLGPTARTTTRSAQVQQTLGNLEWALDNAGFTLGDVMRTWFYNDDILAWYDEFNRVRSAHYAGVKWRTGSLPASTGIGARNPAGAALVLAAWAMQPLDAAARATEIGSPLQCPAPQYGSAFSRAMEINSGGWRRLLISGTASIHPDGKTAWVGNPKKQVDLTMEVVVAILYSRGMSFEDVTRATAYFEHPLFKDHFDAWLAARDLGHLPVVSVHADVCRSDLLFELELDACKAPR